jgi:hypothetical protein
VPIERYDYRFKCNSALLLNRVKSFAGMVSNSRNQSLQLTIAFSPQVRRITLSMGALSSRVENARMQISVACLDNDSQMENYIIHDATTMTSSGGSTKRKRNPSTKTKTTATRSRRKPSTAKAKKTKVVELPPVTPLLPLPPLPIVESTAAAAADLSKKRKGRPKGSRSLPSSVREEKAALKKILDRTGRPVGRPKGSNRRESSSPSAADSETKTSTIEEEEGSEDESEEEEEEKEEEKEETKRDPEAVEDEDVKDIRKLAETPIQAVDKDSDAETTTVTVDLGELLLALSKPKINPFCTLSLMDNTAVVLRYSINLPHAADVVGGHVDIYIPIRQSRTS